MSDGVEFFGDPWDAPVTDSGQKIDTPVGQDCFACLEGIEEGDQGIMIATLIGSSNVPGEVPVHRECHLRNVLGSIGHLLHKCHCFDPNGFEDIPGLTGRENAKLVLAWINTFKTV